MIKNAPLNVIDYGADATGVADSSTAIQAAIDDANTAGGGEVYFPTGIYNLGSNTLVMKSQVILRGDGTQATVIKSSGFVLDYGSWADGGTQNAKLQNLQLLCTGTDGCVVLRGRTGGTSVTGEIWANDVYFNGDQSIVIDETHFRYSGFWNIDKCIFKKFLHLSTSSATNSDGTGMLVNTIRINNSTFGTVSNTTDYAIKFSSLANVNGVNQTSIQGCVFERTSAGGIQYYGGNQHAFCENWFADGTGPYNAVRIESSASFVSIKNVFARDNGGCSLSNASAGPVVVENCNITSGSSLNPVTSTTLPRISSTFTPWTNKLIWGFQNNGNGIYLSTNKLAGMQAINILVPPTVGTGTIAIPVPAHYTDTLFHHILALKLKNGDTATADPGATYTMGIRVRSGSPSGTLFSWTNANTAVDAYEEVLLNTSGAYDGTDYTDFLDATERSFMYIDVIKQGGGVDTGYMYLTLYVM